MDGHIALRIRSRGDALHACREARRLAASLGFTAGDVERIALSAVELAANLAFYARDGVLQLSRHEDERGVAIQLESRDSGPGIEDLALAMQDGYSTRGGLGGGLPAVRRLMDDFSITSSSDGTEIAARKWIRRRS